MAKPAKKPPRKRTSPAELAAHYRALIEDGTLAPGDEVPSQRDIADAEKMSPVTVRRAFEILQNEGLITSKVGVGTRVSTQSDVGITGVARLRRAERTGNYRAPGETSRDHFAGLRSCWSPEIAKLLGIEPGDEVVVRRRVTDKPGKPPNFETSIIHIRALQDVPEAQLNEPLPKWWQDIYKERTGREVYKTPERRTARIINEDEIAAFGLDIGPHQTAAVLVVVNVFHDEDGPLECWEDVYPPGAVQTDGE